MATNVRIGNTVNLELGGLPAGPLRSLQPPGYRVDPATLAQAGGTVVRGGSTVTLGEMVTEFSPNAPGSLRDWVQAFAAGDLSPRGGVAQVLDHNASLRRSLAFEGGEITQLRLPALSAADGRTPLLLGLSWRMQSLKDDTGDGRKVTVAPNRAKAMLVSNFRTTGLPFDGSGVVTVGLPLLRRVDAGTDPRWPGQRLGRLVIGDLTLAVAGRSTDLARAWVQKVVADGRLEDTERVDITVELLDSSLKTVLGTVQLQGCRLLACDEPPIDGSVDTLVRLSLRLAVGRVLLAFGKG